MPRIWELVIRSYSKYCILICRGFTAPYVDLPYERCSTMDSLLSAAWPVWV
jgi:hypothetical protein